MIMTDVMESAPRASNPPATDKLAGRVAFVTGGTRGIGAAIAHSLANQGATVAVGYSRDSDGAEQFVADLLATTRPHGASASAHAVMSAPPAIAAARSPRSSTPTGASTSWSTTPVSPWTRRSPR
jgi:NAD(P)-dependent dehydrogenase (short-subunit alcohol dehydrogenase family)